MITRISTGIEVMDHKIQGGYPSGSVVLYLGIPGSGKTLAGLKFLQQGLKEGEKGLLITTKHSYEEIQALCDQLSFDFNQLECVDCVNWRLKRMDKNQPSKSKYEVQNLADLNTILAVTMQACKDVPEIKRIVFDSPSSMLIYSTPPTEQIYRFFELLVSFVKQSNRILVFNLEKETHSKNVEKTFEYLSDGLVEFSSNGKNSREIKVHYLNLTKCDNSNSEFTLW